MVNGEVAKTTNVAVAILLAIGMIAVVILAVNGREIPNEITYIVTTGLGFLVGTRFTPLGPQGTYTEKKPNQLQDDDMVITKVHRS